MKTDLNKQGQILSQIGLKHIMVWPDKYFFPIYDQRKFKNYVTSEYEESQRKKTDEVYRMSEFNLLHIDSGLRLTLTEHESYDGETSEYKVIRMFIITSIGEEFEVIDADFGNEIFYTTDLEIPFTDTNESIEFGGVDCITPNDPKVTIEEVGEIQKVILDSSDTNESIEFGDKDYSAPPFPKEELEEMKVGGMQKVILDLQLRRRKPKGKQEEELFKQILEAEAKGYTIHLPLE